MSHNPIRPWRNIDRRKSRQIMVGKVAVGGDAPAPRSQCLGNESVRMQPPEAAADLGAGPFRVIDAGAWQKRSVQLRLVTQGQPLV
jgi:(E)-4-hydroxy-3-methylbut-2-enyl-diphosphate synthase